MKTTYDLSYWGTELLLTVTIQIRNTIIKADIERSGNVYLYAQPMAFSHYINLYRESKYGLINFCPTKEDAVQVYNALKKFSEKYDRLICKN